MVTADKVKNQIQSLIDTANEKTGKEDVDLTSAVGSLVDGYGQGGNQLDLMGRMTSLQCSYKGAIFPTDTELDIHIGKYANIDVDCLTGAFYYSKGLKSVKLSCESRNVSMSAITAFQTCTDLEVIDLTNFNRVISKTTQMFHSCERLKRVLGELDFSAVINVAYMNSVFGYCEQLTDIAFKQGCLKYSISFPQSPLLSDASIQSIIDGLADLIGQTAQTLTFHADVKAKLTEAQIATITSKNWTLA